MSRRYGDAMTQPPPEPGDATPSPTSPAGESTGNAESLGGYPQPPGYQQPPGYPQPYPDQGMTPYVDPQAKSKIVAGLLGIFVGGFGVHRFYLGFTKIGVIQIIVTILTCGIGSLWGFVEGILYLIGAGNYTTDATGRPLRD
jgi:TM2 domain-containing membrane protein YozV